MLNDPFRPREGIRSRVMRKIRIKSSSDIKIVERCEREVRGHPKMPSTTALSLFRLEQAARTLFGKPTVISTRISLRTI